MSSSRGNVNGTNRQRKGRARKLAQIESGKVGPVSRGMRPPQILSNIIFHHVFRFKAISAFVGGISVLQVLGVAGAVGTLIDQVQLITSSFKVTRVEMWGMMNAGVPPVISIDWAGFQNTPNREISETTLSSAYPAYISAVPPKNSLASFWQRENDNTQLFILNVPQYTTIDVHLSLILRDAEEAAAAILINGAVTTGVLYYLALDNPNSLVLTSTLVPESLTTIG